MEIKLIFAKSYSRKMSIWLIFFYLSHIKQDDFLDVNGISRSTIAMVETAKTDITLSKLKIIADVLGVNLKELMDFD